MINPLSPPLRSLQWLPQAPHAKSKFLAINEDPEGRRERADKLQTEINKRPTEADAKRADFVSPELAEATVSFYTHDREKTLNSIPIFTGPKMSFTKSPVFSDQKKFSDLRKALAGKAEEFEPRAGRYRMGRLKKTIGYLDELDEHLRYIWHVREISYQPGQVAPNKTFTSGLTVLAIIVYERGKPEPVAVKHLKVTNTDSLGASTTNGFMKVKKALQENMDWQVETAIREAITEMTTLKEMGNGVSGNGVRVEWH